jgi:hypothetical protein
VRFSGRIIGVNYEMEATADYDRKVEVEALWEVDATWTGDVFRRIQSGMSARQIAEEANVTLSNVYGQIGLYNALIEGSVSSSTHVAKGWAGRIRTWLKKKPLSIDLRTALEEQERALNAVANDTQAVQAEASEAVEKSRAAENENIPGIYVYTLPHYVRHPFDLKTGRTLLKVGHSSVDALYRATSQGRITSLPEDPWLLRIYPSDASAEVEKKFHAFLRDFDHEGVKGDRTGAEWFLTSLKALDRIAFTLGLGVRVINDFIIDEESD